MTPERTHCLLKKVEHAAAHGEQILDFGRNESTEPRLKVLLGRRSGLPKERDLVERRCHLLHVLHQRLLPMIHVGPTDPSPHEVGEWNMNIVWSRCFASDV